MYRRIRELREDADLTQKQMSAILHCLLMCDKEVIEV